MKKYYAGLTRHQWMFLITLFIIFNATFVAKLAFSWSPDQVTTAFLEDSLLFVNQTANKNPNPDADSILQFLGKLKSQGKKYSNKKFTPENRINLNQATKEELIAIPGIGEKTAKRILEFRKRHGSFHRIDDLIRVKGIGRKSLEKFKPYLTLGDSI